MSEKTDKLVALAVSQVGGAYVHGAWGDLCTPAHRKRRAELSAAHKADIYADCPVLYGKKETCSGCVHEGKIEADCRGFTDWLLRTAGVIDLYGDTVTTQYCTASNWAGGGTIKNLPDKPCILFRQDTMGRYRHTGFYDGAGYAIHAKGHKAGIVREVVENTSFTHWRYPRGLYDVKGGENTMRTLRKGASGEDVKTLQTALTAAGYLLTVDGKFGTQTRNAVLAYQEAKGLTVDGIVGAMTWAALGVTDVAQDDTQNAQNDTQDAQNDTQDAPAPEVAPVTHAEFDALSARMDAVEKLVAVIATDAGKNEEGKEVI